MPNPPIVRLSHSLYSDVPSTTAGVLPKSSPSGGITDAAAAASSIATGEKIATNQACAVRLLLPRTFAVADHAYHNSSSVATEGGGNRRTAVPTVCAGYGGRDAAGEVQQQAASIQHADGARSSRFCATAECSSFSLQGNRSTNTGIQQSPTTQEGAVLVVVESVLGFSAVRALLRSASAVRRLSSTITSTEEGDDTIERDQPPPEDPSRVHAAGACSHQDAAAAAADHDDDVDAGNTFGAWGCAAAGGGGVSEAVGRLVGWLRIAVAASVALQQQGWPGGNADSGETMPMLETAGKTKGTKVAAAAAAAAASVDGLDVDGDDLLLTVAVAMAEERAHGALYGVTERFDRGTEWSAFDLEPTAAGALGLLGGRTSGEGDNVQSAASREVLEVRLICHPLVTMVPDIRWCLRLIGQAKAFAALLNANAKLSTLGGGYFLTRQVGQAIRLALTQSEVATAIGDLQLAGKCRINVAYNYIWLGQYAEAERIIRAQVTASRAMHDEELETVASIAARFLRRSKKANRRLLLQSQTDVASSESRGGSGDESGGSKIGAGDKWVRQRIDVKTDEWHRVRALPMYCSSGRAAPVGWENDTSRGRQVLS